MLDDIRHEDYNHSMIRRLKGLGLREHVERVRPVLDVGTAALSMIAAGQMRFVREARLERAPVTRRVLEIAGVFPIRDHYYEPLVNPRHLIRDPNEPRDLPGVNLDLERQAEFLAQLRFGSELELLPRHGATRGHFAYDNGNFGPGDAEVLYSLIRYFRPERILEVGSGYSTLVACAALERNSHDGSRRAVHQCIEPYEMPWLESLPVEVTRERVEQVKLEHFARLRSGDILFIDSSHMVRPQGDVLFLYQEVLPRLASGVIVHIHDVFTPYDYPSRWLVDRVCFWNEQYLLEVMLAAGDRYKPLLGLHALYKLRPDDLFAACPVLKEDRSNEPKSFWMTIT